MERLVSLAPSATSTVQALGAADRLVGVTEHDDLDDVPVVGGWLTPDLDRLDDLDPDLLLTADPLQQEIRDAVADRGYRTFHHEPITLDEVLGGFAAIGEAIGLPEAGQSLARANRDRIEAIRAATPDDAAARPVIYCEEWPDPPMAAGNWVPEAVTIAGGRYPFNDPGARSKPIAPETVTNADPAHVVVHHCGFGQDATADVTGRWELDADLHVIDDGLLNQPGPRLIDGVERLADLIHGVRTDSASPTSH
jgi:iron complex transport system substrate-binding protein